MGIDIDQSISIGFVLEEDEIKQVFGVATPEVSHMEDRFDPKTGAKLEPKKVIDTHSYTTFTLENKKFDGEYELMEALAKHLDVTVDRFGDSFGGRSGYVVGLGHGTGSCDAKRCPELGEIDLQEVIDDLPKLMELGDKLTNLGFSSRKVKIFNCYTVG